MEFLLREDMRNADISTLISAQSLSSFMVSSKKLHSRDQQHKICLDTETLQLDLLMQMVQHHLERPRWLGS